MATKKADPPAASPKTAQGPILNRYTTLPIALDVLKERHITLLSPETWEDRNDAYYLERYREKMKFRSVLAICFSSYRETFHHWRVFSGGSSGVCIEFDKKKILDYVNTIAGFRHQSVSYRWISELQKSKPALETWPFLKRKPFDDEREYRIIYETRTDSLRVKPMTIQLSMIRKITLSPWLPETVAKSVIHAIKNIAGCGGLVVERSSLIDNSGWRQAIA